MRYPFMAFSLLCPNFLHHHREGLWMVRNENFGGKKFRSVFFWKMLKFEKKITQNMIYNKNGSWVKLKEKGRKVSIKLFFRKNSVIRSWVRKWFDVKLLILFISLYFVYCVSLHWTIFQLYFRNNPLYSFIYGKYLKQKQKSYNKKLSNLVWCTILNSFYFSLVCILCISALEYIPTI